MYDLFAGREALESSYFLTRSKALEAFPMLKKDQLVGALVYYDGMYIGEFDGWIMYSNTCG
jgi:glycerol-3-phosphate dehydrogenase